MRHLLASCITCIVLGMTVAVRAQADVPAQPPNQAPVEAPPVSPPDGGVQAAPESEPVEAAPADEVPLEAAAAAEAEAEASITVEPPREVIEEMVVTGSRVKRSKFAASAPVEVLDRAQLERSGATNLADVVQNLTASQGAGPQGGMTQGGVPVSGVVTVNLRGLGEGATLVLVNGRRINPSGASIDTNITDLSTIPLAAVERIEVLRAGASAIYGADAVGGVVNIITRKKFDGLRIDADAQTTSRFDQTDFTGSAAFGAVSERGRVLVAGSYMRRGELNANQRDWTKGSYISTQGQPGAYVPANALGMPLAGARPDPACSMVRGSMPAASPPSSTLCSFDYRAYSPLVGALERINLFSSGEYDLGKHVSIFGEFSASRMRGENISSPSLPLLPYPLIPANHVDNPFVVPDGLPNAGQRTPVLWIGRPLGDVAGAQRNPYADDTMRAVLGLKGDFEGILPGSLLDTWEWELFSMMGVSRYRYTLKDNLRAPLNAALNSCSDSNNLSGCFNPFHSAVDGTGTLNSTQVIRSFSGEMTIMNDHSLQTYNAGMGGSVFKLPGGEAGLAFGGEVRHEWRTGDFDTNANQDNYIFYVGNPDNRTQRNVYSGYGELRLPFFNGLELQTAARVEHYTDIDSTAVSPFAGVTLTPGQWFGENGPALLKRLQLRGNISTAFRAPTVVQTNSSYQTVPTPLRLNPSSTLSTYLPVRRSGNPDLKPETALTLSGGVGWTPIDIMNVFMDIWRYDYQDRIAIEDPQQAVNQDMVAPDSRIVRDPNGSVVGVNVRQVNVSGSTVTSGLDFGLMFSFPGGKRDRDSWNLSAGAVGTYTFVYDIPRGSASPRSIPADPATGAPARILPPADCDGSAAADFDADPSNDTSNDKDVCHVAGKRNQSNFAPPIPRWRVNFPVTFSLAGHSASAIGHLIGGMDDDVQPNLDGSFDWIKAMFTLDLQYGYTFKNVIGEEIVFRLGMYNVFDANPPKVNGSAVAYELGIHDPRGRMYYAKLSGRF